MGATNQTTNYELPLFIGTDKPSWLGDFNGAMNKIDTSIKGNKDEIDSLKTRMTATESVANTASSTSSTALTNANNAQTSANTAQSTANTANTKAEGAQSTANTALSNATTAQNTADTANATAQSALTTANLANTNVDKLSLENFIQYNSAQMSSNYGTIANVSNVTVATNSDGSIGKIYGRIVVNNANTNNDVEVTINNTAIRPSTEITITGSCLRTWIIGTDFNDIANVGAITIQTNGTIKIKANSVANVTRIDMNLLACLLFFKDFGDVA